MIVVNKANSNTKAAAQINRSSDFTLLLRFENLFEEGLGLDDIAQFALKFYTTSDVNYIASFRNNEYKNCRRLDNGELMVIFNNHALPVGNLKCDLMILCPDESFPDGFRKIVKPFDCNCTLINGASVADESTAITVNAPVLKGESFKFDDFTRDNIKQITRTIFVEVESEEEMERMIANGEADDGYIYYIPQTD